MADTTDASSTGEDPDEARDGAAGSAAVAGGILTSRITGLVRERAVGHFLGTGFAADAFAVAFRIPNLLQHLLGEGVLSASFIPVYSRLLGEGRHEEAGRVAGAVLGLLSVATGVVVAVGVLAAEPLTGIIAAGLRDRPETFDLTVRLVRLLFPATGLLVLSAWCLGVLNSHRRFVLSYVAPAVLNLVQVAVLVGAALTVLEAGTVPPDEREAGLATWLAVGTVVGGLAQLLVQVPTTRAVARGLVVSLRRDLPGVRTTLRSFVPVVSARGVVQLSAFVQLFLASFLAAGSLAVLRYAQTMYGLPIALFGMAVAAAELPEFGRDATDGTATRARLRAALARVALLVAPATVGYVVLGDVLVAALFGSGRFDETDAFVVWLVLAAYSLGLIASTQSRVLQSSLYGIGDARTPARVAVVRVVVSVVVGAVLMLQLDRVAVVEGALVVTEQLPVTRPLPPELRAGGPPRLGAVGLGLGAATAAWVEVLALRRALARRGQRASLDRRSRTAIVVATAASLAVSLALRPIVTGWTPVLGAVVAVVVVGTVHLSVARRLGSPDVERVLASLSRRLRRPRR